MARRQTVKKAVDDIRKEHPDAIIDVLRRDGWNHANDLTPLPESEWGVYRVQNVTWYGERMCVIDAS